MTKATNPSDELAAPAKSQFFETLAATPNLTQDEVAFQVDCFTDTELGSYLRDCRDFNRVMTTPAARLLMTRYQAARDRKELFLGYRNFDKMCLCVTGLTSQTIRNYAAGYKTPPKSAARVIAPLTPQEIQDKKDGEALEARTQATIEASKRQAEADRKRVEEKYSPAQKDASVADPLIPSTPVNIVLVNLVAAKTQRLLETAVSLIYELLDVLPVGDLDSTEKEIRKRAIAFLRDNGMKDSPSPAGEKYESAGNGEALHASLDPNALKNEPSQAQTPAIHGLQRNGC